jgi:hypothetical protein
VRIPKPTKDKHIQLPKEQEMELIQQLVLMVIRTSEEVNPIIEPGDGVFYPFTKTISDNLVPTHWVQYEPVKVEKKGLTDIGKKTGVEVTKPVVKTEYEPVRYDVAAIHQSRILGIEKGKFRDDLK